MAGYVESGNIEDNQPVRPAGTFTLEATIRHSDLREDGRKVLLSLQSNARAKLRDIVLSGAGTDFRGGDRNLVITDGASVWTVIPAARLKNLAASRWGSRDLPFPTDPAHLLAPSRPDVPIIARYSSGTRDYEAGTPTLVMTYEPTH